MKKIYIIGISFLILTIISFLTWFFLFDNVAYVSIDINPSIQLSLNRLNRVTSVRSFNREGEIILEDVSIFMNSKEQALESIIKKAIASKYIKVDGKTSVMITVAASKEQANEIVSELTKRINEVIKESKREIDLFKEIVDMKFYQEASKLDVSMGKLSLIKQLIAKDKTLTINNLKDKKIEEIIADFNEYYDSNSEEVDTTSGATPNGGSSTPTGGVDTTSGATTSNTGNNNSNDDDDESEIEDEDEDEYEDD